MSAGHGIADNLALEALTRVDSEEQQLEVAALGKGLESPRRSVLGRFRCVCGRLGCRCVRPRRPAYGWAHAREDTAER